MSNSRTSFIPKLNLLFCAISLMGIAPTAIAEISYRGWGHQGETPSNPTYQTSSSQANSGQTNHSQISNTQGTTSSQTTVYKTTTIRVAGSEGVGSTTTYQSPSYSNTGSSSTAPSPIYPSATPPPPLSPSTYPNYANSGVLGDSSVYYFNEAKNAAERQDTGALYQYEQMMNGGLFAMYPAYWRLDNNISTLNPAAVTQFARQYSGSVMAEKLAADYAETKARAGEYAAVRQVANLITNADRSEACAVALGYNNIGDRRRINAIKSQVWLTTLNQPELCNQLAMEMNSNPAISNQDRQQRMLRMLREGRTGDIMSLSQSLGAPISYYELSEIQVDPNTFLLRFNQLPRSQKNQYLYLYAIGRIADTSYREAAMQVDYDIQQDTMRSQKLLSDQTRQYAYRIVGVKRMNMNTDDGFNQEAVQWFRKSQGQPFNFEESEDYAQAAIRFSQWSDVIFAISAMDSDIQQEPIWQYWLARAYEQTGGNTNKRKATQIYQTLARQNNYYGFLAKDKVGQRLSVSDLGGSSLPVVSSRDSARVLSDPHFARAFALYDAGVSRSYANREWNWAVLQARNNHNTSLLLAAAKMAHDKGWLDRAIYAMDTSDNVNNFALSHPMPYQASVVRYSNNVGIDPAWAYGIMRQESRFVSSARSGVGASGLMQIMPDTARYIARNLGESYSASRANSGDTNIRYGTWYMSDVLADLDYQPVLATAGYNAGPNKARRWQPTFGTLPADQYIESIAYPETRDYVKRVMENATIYSSLLGRYTPLTQRMGVIPPSY